MSSFDTLLDWNDALPESHYTLAEKHSKKADLIVCLGTSLRVQPANKIPLLTLANGGSLVICNLQKTSLDKRATIKIQTKCDGLMSEVMKKLGYNITLGLVAFKLCLKEIIGRIYRLKFRVKMVDTFLLSSMQRLRQTQEHERRNQLLTNRTLLLITSNLSKMN